ncbi:hypothetical protein J1605_001446 [Eschrichtius robustus]|uniref:Uncharacterized protein n=1 Tax=Eschrichtius robustus TaxID=9764 RepID=A0AB34I5K9_ESCRO|nr:hypothetical protein J1605_001446 [Eschrichtius robustus]
MGCITTSITITTPPGDSQGVEQPLTNTKTTTIIITTITNTNTTISSTIIIITTLTTTYTITASTIIPHFHHLHPYSSIIITNRTISVMKTIITIKNKATTSILSSGDKRIHVCKLCSKRVDLLLL